MYRRGPKLKWLTNNFLSFLFLQVLDRLILYLRIVHSVDYYNHCEYPNEDEMPNRCGIMHVRGSPPTAKVSSTELSEYCRNFESKMSAFLQPVATLSQEEFDKLGAKNAEVYPLLYVECIIVLRCTLLVSLTCRSVRWKNLCKPTLKSCRKTSGCARSAGRSSKVRISYVNIFSTSMRRKWPK